MFWELVLGVV
ncbi:hypothetical protein MTR67_040711 [Solanum verrucosum]|uniref:Uncharacterized protein n=1 Tax=Solanum verrucosum TaxID=315347 RepID=A0AAF0ZQ19_SOLVR|nr:hypothetical protein MTR67_040711 [Solanum verrucosum]